MPQWAGSCWYYLRYCDPKNSEHLIDPKISDYWGVPDFYIGGAEHVNLHLLYARFWHHVLVDAGVTKSPEPFPFLLHQGMILGEMEFTLYQDEAGNTISADAAKDREDLTQKPLDENEVEKVGDAWVLKSDHSIKVDARSHKMSKSRGNVVNPDKLIKAIRCRCHAPVFDVPRTDRRHEAVEHARHRRCITIPETSLERGCQ